MALIEATSVRGPADIGTVYGDAVYHNFYGTRLKNVGSPVLENLARQSRAAWDEAVDQYSRFGQSLVTSPVLRSRFASTASA